MTTILSASRRPDIVVFPDGRIDLRKRPVAALGIGEGDVVDIAVDRYERLLYVKYKADRAVGNHAARCIRVHRSGVSLRLFSVQLARYILSLIPGHAEEARLALGDPLETELGLAMPIILKPL